MPDNKKKFYLGGYYLTKLQTQKSGSGANRLVYTCSECINDNLVDTWAYSWIIDNDKQVQDAKENFQLSDIQVNSIRTWVDSKHKEKKLGWVNVFADLQTALEYRNKFFTHLNEIKVMALYFDETERRGILEEFKPQSENMEKIGLGVTLLNSVMEDKNEVFLGFDYIGIETDGSFHTFHCHDIGKELSDKFQLTLNDFGLFDSDDKSEQVLDYLNDEKNGCEPVPWFIAKTKIVMNK
ncbi:hypothetical protein [Chitinophaga sp.]|uniref:hypothetical protein n=1 Tax=Chitinophaga sp. TaxID=1869181 RepID=UPI0031CE8ABB